MQREPSFCRAETTDCKSPIIYRKGIFLDSSHSVREADP